MIYKKYQRKQIAEMADWHEGFDMTGVSVSDVDKQAGSPKIGDKIARNPKNHADRWLVAADYFVDNFAALTAQQEPVAWMWLEGTELLNGTEVEQFERVEFSREKPDYDAYGLTPLYTAPPSGVQPADGRASMQAELGAALGSALSHYKSGDMQACAASLVRIVDLFRGAAKEPR